MAVSAGAPAPAGYCGTPLAKKLGVHAGSRVCAIDAPFGDRSVDRSTDIVKVRAVDAIGSG